MPKGKLILKNADHINQFSNSLKLSFMQKSRENQFHQYTVQEIRWYNKLKMVVSIMQ